MFEDVAGPAGHVLLCLVDGEIALALLVHLVVLVLETPGLRHRSLGIPPSPELQVVTLLRVTGRRLLEGELLVPINGDRAAAAVVEKELDALVIHQETEEFALASVKELHVASFHRTILR